MRLSSEATQAASVVAEMESLRLDLTVAVRWSRHSNVRFNPNRKIQEESCETASKTHFLFVRDYRSGAIADGASRAIG